MRGSNGALVCSNCYDDEHVLSVQYIIILIGTWEKLLQSNFVCQLCKSDSKNIFSIQ